ncbi:helix-turn-helix domain-containing protein [Tepidimicrobium xylanilyticum]|uniref:DNA-binding transcriptional regulator, XRE-family HTH domain n=1 Tax=Tepidimicrobium xylanilyticum TaxID=1123352 RepID=A0A1H3ASX5_9FIRM|nr:helix-turn-helix transcriptional regulator [Tepidimicrobium xylanilyticum]NLW41494.1 helix-turn-helix transcriptional regulator [Tissierellia bacterium]GMG97644.1 hypothetical protein EN5CB1_24700 [Tepidimicrobium xylanilyticum]SDX32501.1 DNA-binding transcriptional regulator, XRE-family HTH domain [Tepidimicrobium xylanilyticum]
MGKIEFGHIIKKYRLKKGITIRELAELTNISTGFIGDIETNRSRPSYENLVKLIQVLDISLEDIFNLQQIEK